MERPTTILLLCFLIWLLILVSALMRWRKEGLKFKVFSRSRPPWLTFVLIAFCVNLINQPRIQTHINRISSDAMALFLLESLLIGIAALSPHLILSLLMWVSRSFKRP